MNQFIISGQIIKLPYSFGNFSKTACFELEATRPYAKGHGEFTPEHLRFSLPMDMASYMSENAHENQYIIVRGYISSHPNKGKDGKVYMNFTLHAEAIEYR